MILLWTNGKLTKISSQTWANGYDSYLDTFTSGTLIVTELTFPQDTYKIFAYADPAWSYALGAQVDVGGSFNNQQINLQSTWPPDTYPQLHGPYSAHFWHSAQFRADNAMQVGFWNSLLGQNGFNLK
jgi:hypothetical protein